MTHLGFNLPGLVERAGDFGADELAIALPQPVYGHFDRPFVQLQLRRQFRLRLGFARPQEGLFERPE